MLDNLTANETKPGIFTTEFWLTVITLILNNLSVLPVPDKYQGLINIASVIGYQLSRGLAKQGVKPGAAQPEVQLNAEEASLYTKSDVAVTTGADGLTDGADDLTRARNDRA